jgi:hypothetical protein
MRRARRVKHVLLGAEARNFCRVQAQWLLSRAQERKGVCLIKGAVGRGG